VLTIVPYYCIPRNDDDKRESIYDRLFEMALRWEPIPAHDPDDLGVDPELVTLGRTVLRRLVQGDCVSEAHRDAAIEYLRKAIEFYSAAPWESYPGRNNEAHTDMVNLLDELAIEVIVVDA